MTLKLHELPADPGKRQKRKRVGRGNSSGWGKSAGRGDKGQQSRAGTTKGKGFEGGQTPLIRRIPKFGFTNISFRIPRCELTLDKLNRFHEGATVDLEALRKARMIKKSIRRVKVIATGELKIKLSVKLQGCSQGARAAIEAKGGTVEIVPS